MDGLYHDRMDEPPVDEDVTRLIERLCLEDILQLRIADISETFDRAGATIERLLAENARLKADLDTTRRTVLDLERMRPLWAQGWTDDSVAAQVSSAALATIWKQLGVSNQTDAMARLNTLSAWRDETSHSLGANAARDAVDAAIAKAEGRT